MRGRIALQKHVVRNRWPLCFVSAELEECARVVASRSFLPNCLPPKQGEDYSLPSFLFEKSSNRTLLGRRFECVNEIAKPLGENFWPKFQVVSDTGRDGIVPEKSLPSFPQLPVHEPIHIMGMNCLE